MKNENPIHIKLEYTEAISGKRDILLIQMTLLKIARAIKTYHSLRKKESQTKLKLFKQLKDANNIIKKIQTTLPKIRINKRIKDEYQEKKPRKGRLEYDKGIEDQLLDIQAKLRALQR